MRCPGEVKVALYQFPEALVSPVSPRRQRSQPLSHQETLKGAKSRQLRGDTIRALGCAEQWTSTWDDVWQRLETYTVVTIQVSHWHLMGARPEMLPKH